MLIKTPEFAGLPSPAWDSLKAVFIRRCLHNNEFIYLQDDDADFFYFVLSGHVRISYLMEDGAAVLCAVLPPGECFGELGIFEDGRHCDMATAIGEAAIAAIPAKTFRALGSRYPEINQALARLVARRYRSYIELTRNLSLKTLPARLAQALLRLADGIGARAPYKGCELPVLGPMVTQADLGLMARGARGNVNRALKAWERSGWIVMQDRNIVIVDRARLEALSIEEGFECVKM